MSKEKRLALLRVISLLAVIGLSVFIFSIRERVEDFARYGYPGVFMTALLANATVLLPAPGVAIIFTMGSIFHPFGVGIAAGMGGALGEMSGYLAGFSGQAIVERTAMYQKTHFWVEKHGTFAILILAAIPNPLFDLAGAAAGITKLPMHKFLLACWIGQTIKMTAFAYAGAASLHWLFS